MVDQVRLTDGEEARLTFLYDNVTKSISQKGFTYYTFACEEGRYSCNNHCVRQIQQAWPGKGGGMQLKRLSATAYQITDVEMGEGGAPSANCRCRSRPAYCRSPNEPRTP